MPDGKETNWEDGKSLDSGDQPVIQPQMFEKMRHSENTKQQSLIQKYLTGWPLVGNEGMNPHHSYVCMVSFPHSLLRATQPIRHVFIKQLFAGLLKGGKMGLFLDRTPGEFSAVRFVLFGMTVVLSLPGKKPGDWIDIMGQKLDDSVTLNHTHKSCHPQVFYPDFL